MRVLDLPDQVFKRLKAIAESETDRFDLIVDAIGLRRDVDFRYRDLSVIDFRGADLTGFDFSFSDLGGARFDNSTKIDTGTIFTGAILPPDFEYFIDSYEFLDRPSQTIRILKEIILQNGDFRARCNALRHYFSVTLLSSESERFFFDEVLTLTKNSNHRERLLEVHSAAKEQKIGIAELLPAASRGIGDASAYSLLSAEGQLRAKQALRKKDAIRSNSLRSLYFWLPENKEALRIATERLKFDKSLDCRVESGRFLLRSVARNSQELRKLSNIQAKRENSPKILSLLFKMSVSGLKKPQEIIGGFEEFSRFGSAHKLGAILGMCDLRHGFEELNTVLLGIANEGSSLVEARYVRKGFLHPPRVGQEDRRRYERLSSKEKKNIRMAIRTGVIYSLLSSEEVDVQETESDVADFINLKVGAEDEDNEIFNRIKAMGLSLGK